MVNGANQEQIPDFITKVNDLEYLIDPKDNYDIGTYRLTLAGYFGTNINSTSFDVEILNSCYQAKIKNSTSLDVESMQTEVKQIIDLSSLFIEPKYCGHFIYSVWPVSVGITVAQLKEDFFQINELTSLGQHELLLKFTDQTGVDQNIVYKYNDVQKVITLEMSQTLTHCGDILSAIIMNDGPDSFAENCFILEQQGTNFTFKININQRDFLEYSIKPILFDIMFNNPSSGENTFPELNNLVTYSYIFDNENKGSAYFNIEVTNSNLVRDDPYQITFLLEVSNYDGQQFLKAFTFDVIIFELKLEDAIEGIASTLKIIKMYTEIGQTLNFPSIQIDSYIIEIDFGIAKRFIKGGYPDYIVNPGKFDEGEYEIRITVKEKEKNLMVYKQTTFIRVVKNNILINVPDTIKEDKGLMVITNKTLISQTLGANIKSIGMSGQSKFQEMGKTHLELHTYRMDISLNRNQGSLQVQITRYLRIFQINFELMVFQRGCRNLLEQSQMLLMELLMEHWLQI
eukprot:403361036